MTPPNPSTATEVNFDGLVGPTHHYGGLSYGNVASMEHQRSPSNPRDAALQGLQKMKRLSERGIPQGFLPPHPRPHIPTLRNHGFEGSISNILSDGYKTNPELLSQACSASSMWAANAATVSPSPDTTDGRCHITPANLSSQPHRAIESSTTTKFLRALLSDIESIEVHDPLNENNGHVDEGAANHMRLTQGHGKPGIEIFVYGRTDPDHQPTEQFPARQTKLACEAIASRHNLDPERTFFLRQHPDAIDAGVFHNDVAAVTNESVCFYHREAYREPEAIESILDRTPWNWHVLSVSNGEIPLSKAVDTYLFNSQIVTNPDGTMTLVAAEECHQNPTVKQYIDQSVINDSSNPICSVKYVDVRQSMKNGGGPACLRLRCVFTPEQRNAIPDQLMVSEDTYNELVAWVKQHYPEHLTLEQLAEESTFLECRHTLKHLWERLDLDEIVEFGKYWEGPLD